MIQLTTREVQTIWTAVYLMKDTRTDPELTRLLKKLTKVVWIPREPSSVATVRWSKKANRRAKR